MAKDVFVDAQGRNAENCQRTGEAVAHDICQCHIPSLNNCVARQHLGVKRDPSSGTGIVEKHWSENIKSKKRRSAWMSCPCRVILSPYTKVGSDLITYTINIACCRTSLYTIYTMSTKQRTPMCTVAKEVT